MAGEEGSELAYGSEAGGQGRIRTSVARKERQIYSLLPLTTRPPVPSMRTTGCHPGQAVIVVRRDHSLGAFESLHAGKAKTPYRNVACQASPAAGKPLAGGRAFHKTKPVLERETGIEPATNSLEGCDSTTELLPPSRLTVPLRRHSGEASPHRPSFHVNRPASLGLPSLCGPGAPAAKAACQPKLARRAKAGGEGRIRTSEATRATDLQSVAFDRSATSPISSGHPTAFSAYGRCDRLTGC